MAYKYFNPNPSNLSVGDCTIRAISKLISKDWQQTYLNLVVQGYIMSDLPSANRVWGSYLESLNFERKLIPNTCPNCYTVVDFCREHPIGKFLLATGEHVIAIIDGDYYDSWDSGREVPLYYYERRE